MSNFRKCSTHAVIWLFAFLTLVPAALAADPNPDAGYGYWPQWRGVQRDGISSDEGLIQDWDATPPKLLWMAEGLGSGWSNVSTAPTSLVK